MKKMAIALAMALLLSACAKGLDRKIDASSEESYRESVTRIKQESKPEDAKRFEDALSALATAEIFGGADTSLVGMLSKIAAAGSPEQFSKQMMSQLNGKTGKEVIAMARDKRRETSRKQLASVTGEIGELQKAKEKHDAAKAVLEKIEVSNPKYYFSDAGFLKAAVLDFSVKNGTTAPLRRLYFHGTVATPGRSVPWISDDFNYEVIGGLEPGESKRLRLQPNMFLGKWNSSELQSRNDLILTVDVLDAENAIGEKLAGGFTKSSSDRLSLLEQQKRQLEKDIASD